MQHFLKIVGNGQRTARGLTPDEADSAFRLIMEGRASLPQLAAFMTALRIKEETAEELAGFVGVLREYCQTTDFICPHLVDVCVPYDGRSRSLSLLPAAALIAASAGAKVVLHGRLGQKLPPKFGVGIGDILVPLGLAVHELLDAAADSLRDDMLGIAYVDVSAFAPALERFNQVRLDFGMRSFFNTIEKLINPFNAPNAIVGVFHSPVMERVAGAMQAQGYRRGLVVQGPEGAIDVLTSRRTPIIDWGLDHQSALQSWAIDPAGFGWWERNGYAAISETAITPTLNAEVTRQLIEHPVEEAALQPLQRAAILTAALIVYASGSVSTYTAALTAAQLALASGEVTARFARWQARPYPLQHAQKVEMAHDR